MPSFSVIIALCATVIFNVNPIDKDLRIDAPLLASRQHGRIGIRGRAAKGSTVKLSITSTYYKLGTDQQKHRLFKGEGPVTGTTKNVVVKVDGQGNWSVKDINIRNHGWSETYKVVARSVTGGNATYVTFTDETRPVVQWE